MGTTFDCAKQYKKLEKEVNMQQIQINGLLYLVEHLMTVVQEIKLKIVTKKKSKL